MAFKNVRTLIRVDCSPISDTKTLSTKLREIEGFDAMFANYNYFKIGETSNYRNGALKEMDPEEYVYRYSREEGGVNYVFDLTSRFFYIRILGEQLPANLSEYFRIMEDATKIVLEHDKFGKVKGYGLGKEYEEKKAQSDDADKIERDSYTSQAQKVRIIYQKREQSNDISYTIIATVNDVEKNPDYSRGEKLYDQAFQVALKEAEEKYG